VLYVNALMLSRLRVSALGSRLACLVSNKRMRWVGYFSNNLTSFSLYCGFDFNCNLLPHFGTDAI